MDSHCIFQSRYQWIHRPYNRLRHIVVQDYHTRDTYYARPHHKKRGNHPMHQNHPSHHLLEDIAQRENI